jgi:hypothetical protein
MIKKNRKKRKKKKKKVEVLIREKGRENRETEGLLCFFSRRGFNDVCDIFIFCECCFSN